MSREGVFVMSCCEQLAQRVAELEAQVAALDARLFSLTARVHEGSADANR